MEVIDYRWIGFLVHDYEATRKFLAEDLGLELEWHDEGRDIAVFAFPSGQRLEIYGPSNRTRDEIFRLFNGPVIGIQVRDIVAARAELEAKGSEFVTDVKGTKDGSVSWVYFWGPDGQFYSLVEKSG